MTNDVRRHIPNLLSWVRLLSLIPLHWLALEGQSKWLALGLLLAGITDVLDGFLARRWACVSRFGSRLDSVVDNLLGLAVTVWLFMLCRDAQEHVGLACYIVVATGAPSALGWLLHKRFVAMHTYSARVAAGCAYATGLYVLAGDLTFGPTQRMLVVSVVTLKAIDELLILALVDGDAVDQEPSILKYARQTLGGDLTVLPKRR